MPGSSQRMGFAPLFASALLAALLAFPSLGETVASESVEAETETALDTEASSESSSQDTPEAVAAAAVRASFLDKLQIHGFLTQAYAEASFVDVGPSSNEVALGIPEDGSSAYRFLALQFRYEISSKDIVVVQFSSRELGFSPIQTLEDEVELDWAFYERRLTDSTSIKVGRVQIPIGIYNEIRDVGTILPFYRPPFGWYSEGSFTSETIDGIVVSNRFFPEYDWNLDLDFYFGEWGEFEIDPANPTAAVPVRAKNAGGLQLWLNTPVPGLRFGAGGNVKKLEGGILRPPGVTSPTSDHTFFSLDGSFDRFVVRGEYRELNSDLIIPLTTIEVGTISWYVQLGFFITEKLQIWGQYDDVNITGNSPLHTRKADTDFRDDLGVSLNYVFRPDLVLKLEYHETEENLPNVRPVPGPGGIRLDPFVVPLGEGSYTILSLSVSF